jgi:glucose-6-phosphate isomerase
MKTHTKREIWAALTSHALSLTPITIAALNKITPNRADSFQVSTNNVHLNFSNQRMTDETLILLLNLAEKCALQEKIHALMRGDTLNRSENRPALHTALRVMDDSPIWVNEKNVILDVVTTRHKMYQIVAQIRAKQWFGHTGKAIINIVNIGIGGSDLGPRFCIKAFIEYASKDLNYYFISDVDPNSFNNAVSGLDPEVTLFIVSSKSFTTKETLYNAKKAIHWLNNCHLDKHLIAITANAERAYQFGICNVLPIWDWVGGRYSVCSAINLITAIAIGEEHFNNMLAGANSMDKHFYKTEFEKNLPVLLALIGIWNNNFLNIHNLLILTYAQQLEYFVSYIQQLDMESNGKSVDNNGKETDYPTGPIVWGGLGNQAQHSYYQLLCQGAHKTTADFITVDIFQDDIINNMCAAKIKVLAEGIHDPINRHARITGNVPLNHISIKDCSPYTIGALLSLYEHKIFTQSVIWDINPFDQPGVESAKRDPVFAL